MDEADVATGFVVTENDAVDEPAGTVIVAGTPAAAVLLLVSVTTVPPAGAVAAKVTTAATVLPPNTDEGFKISGGLTVRVVVFVTLL